MKAWVAITDGEDVGSRRTAANCATISRDLLASEQFVLAVPFAPLCMETCKGLCPQCGIDRNTASCNCDPPIDPRLAALKGLKITS